jgi:hypothetical protein
MSLNMRVLSELASGMACQNAQLYSNWQNQK